MIKNIYNKYFQKSKSFLYPILGIRKTSKFKPLNTYISIKSLIGAEDVRFICTYEKNNSEAFEEFEVDMLIKNPLFIEKLELDDINVYIFDFEIYAADWFNFIMGKYSKLSNITKKAIKAYYGESSNEYKYMNTYLFPEEHYKTYANLLNVNIELIKSTGELCDPCDLEKETLKISEEFLEKFKNSFNFEKTK